MTERDTESNPPKPESRPFQFSLRTLLVAVTLFSILLAVCTPVFRTMRRGARKSGCYKVIGMIELGVLNYEAANGTLPPPYLADENGKPMHSWRVLILPYMEREDLYKRYDFSEPWNGPNNSRLAKEMPLEYRCPEYDGQNEFVTNYVAVVGPETAWPGDKKIRLQDITDGTSNTISIVEIADSDIHWMEPRDMSFEQAIKGVNVDRKHGISSNHLDGACFGWAWGAWDFLPEDIDPEVLRGMLTIDGGEPHPPHE